MNLSRRTDSPREEKSPARLVIWAVVLGLIFGLIGAGEYPEDRMRAMRTHANVRPVSGDIVLVGIDEKSLKEVGRWPWPRDVYADLVRKIDAAGVRVQLHDIVFPDTSEPARDRALVNATADANGVYFAYLSRFGAESRRTTDLRSFDALNRHTKAGSINVDFNYAHEVWRLKQAVPSGNSWTPTFATIMAGKPGSRGTDFRVNYAFNPDTVTKVSASDILDNRIDPGMLRGKTVIVGTTGEFLNDVYMMPGWGPYNGVYIHIIGAETLKAGTPIDLGWIPGYILAAMIAAVAVAGRSRRQPAILGAATALLIFAPIPLEGRQIFIDITPGLFVVLWVSVGLINKHVKRRGLVNTVSGLPNLHALRRARHERDRPLVAARILNFPQIVSTLSLENERNLVDQIVARLKVGSEVNTVYQGDEGIFAWTVPPGTAIGHHIEALHALFRSPAKIDRRPFDIPITFGVEIGSGRSLANRLGSALVAADEAYAEGLRWKYHDPERLKDVQWRLSLLGQLDNAIDDGQVWVAFQPQMDLATGVLRGAEALARWTHPEKGPISPNEFIGAAEQNDRIEKLTFFVLEKAVAAAAKINRDQGPFDMAVNLSARMLGDRSLPGKVSALLARHALNPARLTLELTETATLSTNGSGIEPLFRLRDLGVKISIDDYGTGLSTLEYLKKIPASEIKIDQSFIKSMRDNRSDLVMVQSTIALAHSLGRTVVAEGVETRETLDLLVAMKCEVAQGFLIARPCSLGDLTKRLVAERKRRAA